MAPVDGSGCCPACTHTVSKRAVFGSFMAMSGPRRSTIVCYHSSFNFAFSPPAYTTWPALSDHVVFAGRYPRSAGARDAAGGRRSPSQNRVTRLDRVGRLGGTGRASPLPVPADVARPPQADPVVSVPWSRAGRARGG